MRLRNLSVLVAAAAATGCAGMVTANDGDRVTVEHDAFVSIADVHSIALSGCNQAGKAHAVFVSSANKNPRFEPGFGVQLSTFRCS